MTVTNHSRRIATQGSGHMGTTMTPTDVCYKAPKADPAPFDNYNPTSNLTNATTKTFIGGVPIWTATGILAAPSQPAHAGIHKGVKSDTYCDITEPTSWSQDLRFEGAGGVRTEDTTKQNKGNTTGQVSQMTAEQQLKAQQDLMAGLDKLVKLDGLCTHGRPLDIPRGGQRTGEMLYLEILNEDTVIFQAERKNAFTNGDPDCRQGGHTQWQATRSGVTTHVEVGDIFILPGAFTDIPGFEKSKEWQDKEKALAAEMPQDQTFESKEAYDKAQAEEKARSQVYKPADPNATDLLDPRAWGGMKDPDQPFELKGVPILGQPHDQDDAGFRGEMDKKRQGAYQNQENGKIQPVPDPEPVPDPRKPKGIDGPTPTRAKDRAKQRNRQQQYNKELKKAEAERQRRAQEVTDERARRQTEANERAKQLFDEDKAMRRNRTLALQIAATAVKNFALLAKLWNAHTNPPEIQVTATACSGSKTAILKVFPVQKFEFDLFSDAISTALEAINKLPKLCKTFGSTFGIDVVSEFFVDPRAFLTIQYKELFADGNNGWKKGCVNRSWELKLSFEKMWYLFVELSVPLRVLLSPNPAMSLALQALEWIGIESKGFFKVEFVLNPTLMGIWTEYDDYSVAFEVTFKIELQLGAKVSWGKLNEVGVALFTEFGWTFNDARITPERLAEFFYQGKGKAGVKGWAHFDFWGFRHNIDAAWVVAEADLGQGWLAPLAVFK
jgi:hypothetical protein